MQFLNQHSFTLISTVLLLILVVLSLQRGVRWKQLAAMGVLAVSLFLIFLLLSPSTGVDVNTEEILAVINTGGPVLLEFQSPY